jgi:hypothetical protein
VRYRVLYVVHHAHKFEPGLDVEAWGFLFELRVFVLSREFDLEQVFDQVFLLAIGVDHLHSWAQLIEDKAEALFSILLLSTALFVSLGKHRIPLSNHGKKVEWRVSRSRLFQLLVCAAHDTYHSARDFSLVCRLEGL